LASDLARATVSCAAPPGNISLVAGVADIAIRPSAQAAHGAALPYRQDAHALVAMFGIADAGTPAWHRARANTLLREAKDQPVAALTDAWWRLAARHLATAEHLERQA
jgi:hypothetical protein